MSAIIVDGNGGNNPNLSLSANNLGAGVQNQVTLQAGLNTGGIVAIVDEGRYEVVSDSFTYPANTYLYLAPGVQFTIKGVVTELTSLAPIRNNVQGQQAFDVVVYGGTPAGVHAAVAAARLNKRVLLVSENDRIGGMQGWGITQTDVDTDVTPGVIVGSAREYFLAVANKESNSVKTFQSFVRISAAGRPSWFIRAFNEMVAREPNITTVYNTILSSVSKSGTRITSINFTGGPIATASAAQYIDATYTGDLIAAAGCSFSIGRESTALYGEAAAGVLPTGGWVGSVTLDPYVTPGNPASGLLLGIDPEPLGTLGSGDGRVMAFGYRLFVTNNAPDRAPFPNPDFGYYNPANYELMARAMQLAPASYSTLASIVQLYNLSTGSFVDLNNRGSSPASSNWVSPECLEYITANEARRRQIRENARQWLLGLFYWISTSTDPRIPAALKTDLATYGLSNVELAAYAGFSPELYVREGRRLLGDYIMNQNNMILNNGVTDPIAFGYYDIDSHVVRRLVVSGNAVNEGSQLTALTATQLGFPIALRTLFPRVTECTNLTSPTAPSVSRVVWSSIRMEPILMAMGQAAGIAAALAVENNGRVQDVNYARLARVQDIYRVWDGLTLSTDGTFGAGTVTVGGTWATVATASASARFGYLGGSFRTASPGANTLTFAFTIRETATYEVFIKYPPDTTGRANNVSVTVNHAGGAAALTVNQLYPGGVGGDWESLGTYTLRAGLPSVDTIVVSASGASDTVAMSAVKIVQK